MKNTQRERQVSRELSDALNATLVTDYQNMTVDEIFFEAQDEHAAELANERYFEERPDLNHEPDDWGGAR